MTIQGRGPVIATIASFSALILILAGFMIGWKWIAPTIEEEVIVEERDLITAIESIPNIENWSLEYESWNVSYDMMVDIGDEIIYFIRRYKKYIL